MVDETSDLSVYETNMNLLYDALTRLGFDVVRPGGTFYIFPKALEEDANAFCMKAKDYDLILVPSDSFGVPGYFRMAYCIDTEKVERSIAALEKFVQRCTAAEPLAYFAYIPLIDGGFALVPDAISLMDGG